MSDTNNETETTEKTQPLGSSVIDNWTDDELTAEILYLLESGRLGIRSDYIQNDDDDLIVASVLMIRIGGQVISSEPNPFEWPLTLAPLADLTVEEVTKN